ncbi:protein TIME FOR COFFEE-like isoform X3 [Mangifera indica]|uniref:protein TIME FOR COFFEE-like isoform X3 n=1 Tax=Mangifera indica TaxID=29780 RepID=UPI001CFA4975|nr:protein TIME FOR COFFEE-like isoform X3 [Mangifera indica]
MRNQLKGTPKPGEKKGSNRGEKRSREARRSNMAATNGLSRRRQRTSNLRDSQEEDEEMELQDTARLRDRSNRRDRDRDRDGERYRDRDFSNHKSHHKRRRGDSLTQGDEESAEESVADEEEYEIEERRVASIISQNTTSYSSPSLSNQNSRKSLPPTRHVRPTPPDLKAADEMIGVMVPRKARSASVKRLHENWASGNGGFWEDHRASTSSRSIEKSNGPKTRLPKAAKSSSSVQQDDIEIEIAEVLFGLMKQSQNSKKEDDSFGKTVQKLESEDGISNNPDAKPSVSVLARKDSASSDLGGATKKKVEVDNSSNPVCSAVKFESEQLPTKSEISTPKLEKASQLNVASCEASNEIDAPKVESVTVEPQEEVPKQGDTKLSIEGSDCPSPPMTEKKSVSADKESSATCCNMDSTVTKASSTVLETGGSKVEKFKIDLMAPPPMVLSPEQDGFSDFASYHATTAQYINMKSLVRDEEKEKFVKKETAVQEVEEKKIEPIEEKSKLKFDLEKSNLDDRRDSASKLQHHSQKQEPPKSAVPRVERTGQSGSVPFQVAVAGWPNGLPPLGYMPPFQTIVSVDGSARSAPTQQPPQFMLSQPRPKRCATHHHIARNIYLNQQFAKMNHLWPAGASSTSLIGAKSSPSTENLIHGNQLQGSFPVVNINSVQEKGQTATNFPDLTQKDKSSENVNLMDPVQRKQLVLQQAPHATSAGNFLHAPAFIFPVSQQQAAITAAANQSGSSKSATSAKSASFSGNSTASIPVSSTALPAVAAAASYNYPNMAASGAPYLTIVQNDGFPFPVPTPIGAPPGVRGAHPQPLPYFNGSFYSSQIFHPAQLQQQQQPHSQPLIQAVYQNTTVSSVSSASHKQTQPQNTRGGSMSGNLLSSTSMLPHQQQKQHVPPSNQNRRLEPEMSGENAPSLCDSRVSHNQTSVYGQNFTVPLQPLNFSLMPSQVVGGTAAGGNHGEKQQKSQQTSLKGGVELIPSQAFAMPFGSFGGNVSASNLNFSSMAQNPAIFQGLPDIARQGYQVSPAALVAQQKNHQISEVKTGGGSSNHDDGKKTSFGKSPTSNGQTLVFDHSARTLNFVSSPVTGNWSSRPVTSTIITKNAPAAANSQNFQQQQLLQIQKQSMLQHQQQTSAVARSKASSTNLSSSSNATKLSNNASVFPQTLVQSNSSSQSPQWKNSVRTQTSQVPPTSLTSSNSLTLKNVSQQQQVRTPQGYTQISFERNSKSGLSHQGQQIPTSSQSPSPLVVGSSSPSGGNLRTCSAGSKAGSALPNLQPQQTENSSASTGQKNSPVCGRNVPSILSTCPGHLSELKY